MSGVRSLEILHKHGSTSRVLDLLRVWENFGTTSEHSSHPMFTNQKLNKSLIVKHRLRKDEEYLMNRHKKVVTKIIFPLIGSELNFGGQSIIYGQKNFKIALKEATGAEGEQYEEAMDMLRVLDKLPSLDPFLLRETLKRSGYVPANCYFDISPSDAEKMQNFAAVEVSRLIEIAFAGLQGDKVTEIIHKMVNLILSDEADERLDPLRIALGLDGHDFREGIFAWRGFLYFKWQIDEVFREIPAISAKFERIKLSNKTYESEAVINRLIASVKDRISEAVMKCNKLVSLYDRAYADLIERAKAAAFREFLLSGPKLFIELGTLMGSLVHVTSYWNFRFKEDTGFSVDAADFESILRDFVLALGGDISNLIHEGAV